VKTERSTHTRTPLA